MTCSSVFICPKCHKVSILKLNLTVSILSKRMENVGSAPAIHTTGLVSASLYFSDQQLRGGRRRQKYHISRDLLWTNDPFGHRVLKITKHNVCLFVGSKKGYIEWCPPLRPPNVVNNFLIIYLQRGLLYGVTQRWYDCQNVTRKGFYGHKGTLARRSPWGRDRGHRQGNCPESVGHAVTLPPSQIANVVRFSVPLYFYDQAFIS